MSTSALVEPLLLINGRTQDLTDTHVVHNFTLHNTFLLARYARLRYCLCHVPGKAHTALRACSWHTCGTRVIAHLFAELRFGEVRLGSERLGSEGN